MKSGHQCLTADKSATDKLMILLRNLSFISYYQGRRVRILLLEKAAH